MYFVLKVIITKYADEKFEVIGFYKTTEEFNLYFPLFTDFQSGVIGFSYPNGNGTYTNYKFVNYLKFFTQEYTKTYSNPPIEVRLCTAYLNKLKLNYLLNEI